MNLYESVKNNLKDTSSLANKVVLFGGPNSDFGVLYKEDLNRWKASLKRRNIEILNISDDLVFTVRGKIKDIYDFYNKIVDSGSLGIDYNNIEEFADWAGLLDKSSQDEILNSIPEQQEDEADWKSIKDALPECTDQASILSLLEKYMSEDTYIEYWARFAKKHNGRNLYWPYSTNKMKEVLMKISDQKLNK